MSQNVSSGVFYGQVGGFLVAFTSSVTCVVTCCWNQWRKTGPDSASLLGAIWGFDGIWIQCMQHTTGQFQCNDFQTPVFEMAPYINVIRAFMCIAIILSVLGCFACLVGMQASRLLETAPNAKRIMMRISGGFFIGAGVLTGTSLAWYSAEVIQAHSSYWDADNMMRYTIGATMYVGVISGILSLTAGFTLICLPGPKEEKTSYNFENVARMPYSNPTKLSVRKGSLRYGASERSDRRSVVQYV